VPKQVTDSQSSDPCVLPVLMSLVDNVVMNEHDTLSSFDNSSVQATEPQPIFSVAKTGDGTRERYRLSAATRVEC